MYAGTQYVRRTSILLGLSLLIALVAGACTFEVQPIEQYTSEDGYLRVTYPAAWELLDEDVSRGTNTVFLGTHEDLINMDVIPSGEAGVAIMLMPNFIPEPGMDTLVLGAEELADFMLDDAVQGGAAGESTEVEAVTLSDGTEAYTFGVSTAEADMAIYTFAPADEMLVIAAFITAPGEEDAALAVEMDDILSSIRFDGDAAEFADRAREALSGG